MLDWVFGCRQDYGYGYAELHTEMVQAGDDDINQATSS